MKRNAVAALVACAPGVVPAQCQGSTGTLEGQVTDLDSRAVNAARIRARNVETGRVRESLSNDAGCGREMTELPHNGRNFTQLGLLQAGVAPLTAGVATAGGRCARIRHTL